MQRTKRVAALEDELYDKAKTICREFAPFITGTRYLTMLHRSKDDGPATEYKRRGAYFVVHDEAEYLNALVRLLTLQIVSSKPYRIYASVNSRNIAKAEKAFKMDMLVTDFDAGENKRWFWERLPSKWISALMQPGSRDGSLFLIDIDGEGDITAPALKWLGEHNVEIIKQYKTPNGWHVITKPFNPNDYSEILLGEIKKDGLLLLAA